MTTGKKTIFYIFVLLIQGCGPVCLSPRHVKAILIWSISSADMKLRMFLVYTEPSTMRIGDAGFEQLANMISFLFLISCLWHNFPSKNVFFCHREMLFKTLLMPKNRDKYALFLHKLFTPFSFVNVLKKGKTSTSYLSPSWHATCVVASNLRSPEFGCITYAEG